MQQQASSPWPKRLAWLGVIMAIVVIGLGAFTRLVDAGLGCPDWPTCYGHVLWPESEAEIAAANERFAATPVEMDKTWPEQVHRIFASNLGLVVLAIFAFALRERSPGQRAVDILALLGLLVAGTIARMVTGDGMDPVLLVLVAAYGALIAYRSANEGVSGRPYKLPAFLAGFVILQGLFGMWTVTLNLWPQVVTAHLLGGFTTLALLWLLVLRYEGDHWQLTRADIGRLLRLAPLAKIALVVVVIQIALGGWTTSNYAAVACPDLPTCQGEWFPKADFGKGFNMLQSIGPNYLGGTMDNASRIAIHLSHRIGAIVTLLVVGLLVLRLWQVRAKPAQQGAAILGGVLLLQIALGLSNVLFNFPLWVAVAHNITGALLLLAVVTLLYRLRTAWSE